MNNMYSPYGNQYPTYQYQKPTENINWIYVSDISKVEQVNVLAGCKAWVMVQNEPVFALRTADNMGLVSTDYYKFEKYNPVNEKIESEKNYVTHDEMNNAINEVLKEIRKNESIISERISESTKGSRTAAKHTDDN